jgi:hypothetical protein
MSTTRDNEAIEIKAKQKRKITFIVSGVLVALVAATGLIWLIQQVYQSNLQRIDTSAYQVVFLSNGQSYFGKLQNTGGDFLVMKSPYTAQTAKDSTTSADTTTLVRVKDQVYGPEDSIAIKSSQVTSWQNLRSDSKVTTAIDSKNK